MIRRALLLAVVTLVVAPSTRAQDDELASPALRIDWPSFKKLYDAGDLVLIDVRDRASYQAGHIPGARSIPLDDIDEHASALKRAKKPIVLYCA
jgi:rhodanese-related sulfurtransferase